jgi:hypothetical protein
MARSVIASPDEALAGMEKVGAPRKPMRKEGVKFSAASPKKGKLMKKTGNAKSGDPSAYGTKKNRKNELRTPAERNGAAYSVRSARYMKMTDPSAGQTQANGIVVAHAVKRDRKNFDTAVDAAY